MQLNGDWLKMQELVHRLNTLSEESESMKKVKLYNNNNNIFVKEKIYFKFQEKRGIIPFSTSHDFMSPTALGDLMSYY